MGDQAGICVESWLQDVLFFSSSTRKSICFSVKRSEALFATSLRVLLHFMPLLTQPDLLFSDLHQHQREKRNRRKARQGWEKKKRRRWEEDAVTEGEGETGFMLRDADEEGNQTK